jgi:hypothetical protein
VRDAEADERVANFGALISRHLGLMKELESCGADLTSAEIILDSLRISLFVAAPAWHHARFDDAQDELPKDTRRGSAVLELNSHFAVVVSAATSRSATPAPEKVLAISAKHEFASLTKKSICGPVESLSSATHNHREDDSSTQLFDFRPLTREEKNELIAAFEPTNRRLLAALADKVVYLAGSAA